jgi:hypothetical protein
LCTEESESLNEDGVFEGAVVSSKHSNLTDEEKDDGHTKSSQRNAHVSQKGRKRQEHYIYTGCHGSSTMISDWRYGEGQ